MGYVDAEIARLADRQVGLVRRSDLDRLGVTPSQSDQRVANGLFLPLHPGVWLVRPHPLTDWVRVVAACFTLGTDTVVSHRSAAVHWGLRGAKAEVPEISLRRTTGTQPKRVLVHRTRTLAEVDVVDLGVVDVTSPPRTLLDLGAVLRPEAVEAMVEDAFFSGLVTFAALQRVLRRSGGRGQPGAGVLRAIVEARDPRLAPPEGELELRVVRLLRRHGIAVPASQYSVGPVRLDLAWPAWRLGVELDSRRWHSGRRDVERNARKHNSLVNRGWRVLRFTWADLELRPTAVVAEIQGLLTEAA